MRIFQIGAQQIGTSSKIGQHVKSVGNKFVNNCVDFTISSQDKIGNLSCVDETIAGKFVKKISKSSSLQYATDGFVNTFKILGKGLVEFVRSIGAK